jgi:hypothetical protein
MMVRLPDTSHQYTVNLPRSDLEELKGLEALEYQMNRNVESLRQQRQNAKFSGTFRGMLLNWSGRVFAVYCILRVVTVGFCSFAS